MKDAKPLSHEYIIFGKVWDIVRFIELVLCDDLRLIPNRMPFHDAYAIMCASQQYNEKYKKSHEQL